MTDPAPSLSSNPTVDKPIAEDASGAVSMSFDLERSVEVLERTPKTLAAMLRGVSDFWAKSNYGPDTFSPFDVVGHLIEGEKHNWIVRAKHILEHGDRKPFAAFDRYAMYTLNDSRTMDDLLTEFALRREANLAELRGLHLTPAQLAAKGAHPDLGPVTLAQLLASWVVHDLGHTHQIAKAMAYQYRDAVGPWVKFLTILPRP
jgi:hypothetical protein